jgi:cell division protein FtsQ
MLKKINWKAIFKGFAWLVCLAGLGVLMSFIAVKKQDVKCTKVEILIPGADNFIEREEIDALLKQEHGQLIGRDLKRINIHEIEKALIANPYIAFAKVYADMDGVLQIEVKQRQPVLRILNAGGQDFYIDTEGLKMPMSPNFTAKVLVATGNIVESFGGRVDTLLTPLAADLYQTALFFKKDQLWDAQMEQMYVNEKNDIELIPRVGNQRIILGDATSLETKMSNLLAFYKQAMPKVGWNAYKTINLKYTNQIVCEKYDPKEVNKAIEQHSLDSAAAIVPSVDSLIKEAIKEEVKKVEVAKKEAVTKKETSTNKEPKPAVKEKAAEKPITKPVEKTPVKSTKTTATDKSATTKASAKTKEKTDTKKP